MTDPDDIDMLAAEYVLGTLDHDERSRVAEQRYTNAELDAAIIAWEQRLGPLNERADDARPSAELFDRIAARIDAQEARKANGPAPTTPADVIKLRSRVARWRRIAVAASAIAATLAGVLILNVATLPSKSQQYVAVFNTGDEQPQFVMSIDLRTRQLTIRPINAQAAANKSYELWIVSDNIELRSLGLLDATSKSTRKQLVEYDASQLQDATFGISLEPKGGSRAGKPTGPAIHGKLIPASN